MSTISLIGRVDDQHRLVATVPESIAPGPIEILLTVPTRDEDAAGGHWMQGVSQAWHDDLSDERQDIYTLADGVPTDETR